MSIHSLDREPIFPNIRLRNSESYMSFANIDETQIASPELPSPSTHDMGCKKTNYSIFMEMFQNIFLFKLSTIATAK
jgi:hypothetical protein